MNARCRHHYPMSAAPQITGEQFRHPGRRQGKAKNHWAGSILTVPHTTVQRPRLLESGLFVCVSCARYCTDAGNDTRTATCLRSGVETHAQAMHTVHDSLTSPNQPSCGMWLSFFLKSPRDIGPSCVAWHRALLAWGSATIMAQRPPTPLATPMRPDGEVLHGSQLKPRFLYHLECPVYRSILGSSATECWCNSGCPDACGHNVRAEGRCMQARSRGYCSLVTKRNEDMPFNQRVICNAKRWGCWMRSQALPDAICL